MQVTVLGATGKVGRLVVSRLLDEGYTVKAFVHSHSTLNKHQNLRIITGDVHSADDISLAISDSNAVISALASWGSPNKDILASAMEQLIPVMEQRGISRIISLTGAEARAAGDELSIVHRVGHLALTVLGGKVLRDGEKHIALLERSQLDWTVIRSPIMTTGAKQQCQLSLSRPVPWSTIRRQSVIEVMVRQLDDVTWFRQAPYISGA